MTVIPRRCIAGPQLKLYSCPTMHNYSRFRVLGTYAKQGTGFSVDFPSEIVACIGGIALKRSGHDFSFTNRSSGRCCDFAPPWSQRTGGTTISSVPICPVITENGNTVTGRSKRFCDTHRLDSLIALEVASSPPIPAPTTCVLAVTREIFFLSCR